METYIIYEVLSNGEVRETALAEVKQEQDIVKIIKGLYGKAKWKAKTDKRYDNVVYNYDSFEDWGDWL